MGLARSLTDTEIKNAVISQVAAFHGMSPDLVTLRTRQREIVYCRNEAFAHLRQLGWSLPRIAKSFGMDHTSVLHGVRKHDATAVGQLRKIVLWPEKPEKPAVGSAAWWKARGF